MTPHGDSPEERCPACNSNHRWISGIKGRCTDPWHDSPTKQEETVWGGIPVRVDDRVPDPPGYIIVPSGVDPEKFMDALAESDPPNPSERREWRLVICVNCREPLSPESTEGAWCHCEDTDFEDARRTYEVVEVVEASALTAAEEERDKAIELAKRGARGTFEGSALSSELEARAEAAEQDAASMRTEIEKVMVEFMDKRFATHHLQTLARADGDTFSALRHGEAVAVYQECANRLNRVLRSLSQRGEGKDA